MSDIYNIPNDDGKTYRLKKFVEYQHEVPSIHYRFLGEAIRKRGTQVNDAVFLCFLMAVTYNEITCLLLYELRKKHTDDEIWAKYKQILNFGSARKYAKNNDQYVDLVNGFNSITGQDYIGWLRRVADGTPEENYKKIQREIQRINGVGRFAADLFLECVSYIDWTTGVKITEPTVIDWKNCANLTSGIYNIFYEDERANEFDRTGKVTDTEKMYLSSKLKKIQAEIKKTYPDQDAEINLFIGKICSFRNLFKNARYGGFHHDRELGVIKEYEKSLPEYEWLWKECYEIRQDIFPKRFLGEVNGWDGIRKERKRIWLTTGKTGAENE